MSLMDAIVIYLYQQHQAPGNRDEAAYREAWKVIVKYGVDALDRFNFHPSNST